MIMTSKTPFSGSLVVEGVSSAIVEVCGQILPKLEGNSFSQEDVFAVHLALEEAFANAVRHGNKMDPSKEVTIEYSVDSEKVEISVSDQGNGFNPEVVPDPRSRENLYKTDGRGLFLIHSYMDVVKYNERGNSLYMVRYKEKPPIMRGRGKAQG